VPVIKVKSLDLADITVGGTDRKIFELVRTSQHGFARPARSTIVIQLSKANATTGGER
jgi:hypothetical protein